MKVKINQNFINIFCESLIHIDRQDIDYCIVIMARRVDPTKISDIIINLFKDFLCPRRLVMIR